MKTQKQLIAEHRKKLDKQWHKQYPDGKYTYHHFVKANYIELVYETRRRTSHAVPFCLCVQYDTVTRKITYPNYMNCSFGKTKSFSSFFQLINYAKFKGELSHAEIKVFNDKFHALTSQPALRPCPTANEIAPQTVGQRRIIANLKKQIGDTRQAKPDGPPAT